MSSDRKGFVKWSIDPDRLTEDHILPIEGKEKITKEIKKKEILKEYFKQFRDCEFWIWDKELHANRYHFLEGKCCFNHMIGLPEKGGRPRPLFEYQHEIYDLVWNATKSEKERFIWIKKATGLGVTELVLRLMGWLALRNDDFARSEMCIITGPNVDLANDLITRLKDLFANPQNNLGRMINDFETAEDEVTLNKVAIKAFPSHHLNAMRGRPNISLVFVDEADFFPLGMQNKVRTVTERYIAKSHAIIIMVSTPNEPGGLFEKMEREIKLGNEGLGVKSLYVGLEINWEKGLEKPGVPNMFTQDEIDRQMLTPDFEREYNLSYGGTSGNILTSVQINKVEELGAKLGSKIDDSLGVETLDFNQYSTKILGVDPGYIDSKFGITVVEFLENVEIDKEPKSLLRVIYSQDLEKVDYNQALDVCWKLIVKFDIKRVYVDGSQTNIIRSLKHNFGEEMDYHNDKSDMSTWAVFPVQFTKDAKPLLQKLVKFVSKEKLAINPRFKELISQLRTARHENWALKKDNTTYDGLDSLRCAVKHFAF